MAKSVGMINKTALKSSGHALHNAETCSLGAGLQGDQNSKGNLAAHRNGWVLATGNAGRVLLLSRSGQLTTLLEASDPTVFAVAVDGAGSVYAGTSPDGTIYKITDGVAEVFAKRSRVLSSMRRTR